MKINKEDLREIIQEQMNVLGMNAPKQGMSEHMHMRGEGRMAQRQLPRIAELAEQVASKFDENTNLEEWVESKITKAEDYLSSVLNYMEGRD